MNTFLWVVAALLAVACLGAGAMKLARSREQLAASGMGWVEDFSPAMVKLIAASEVLGAVGLILPPLVDIAPVLAPVAATGLVIVFVGAVAVHVRRGETKEAAPSLVLLLLSVVVAVGRFFVSPF